MNKKLNSQRLLHIAVERNPELLTQSFRRCGAIARNETLQWVSPLAMEGYSEYRDQAALRKLGLEGRLNIPLDKFWPKRGAVWDGLAVSSTGRRILVEAKAHIPETISGPSQAKSRKSQALIKASLAETQRFFGVKKSGAPSGMVTDWNGCYYQYANRLAHQCFLHEMNNVDSVLIFLYFTNAVDMDGPSTEAEWNGAIRLIHASLGLRKDLRCFGVFKAFLDATML